MTKAYQPIVIEEGEHLLQGLVISGFFDDFEIADLTYAREYLLDKMTEKFINGQLMDDETELFTEEEFTILLQEIVAGTILFGLKTKGLVESYEDDQTEETFFLTEEGKKFLNDTKEDEEDGIT